MSYDLALDLEASYMRMWSNHGRRVESLYYLELSSSLEGYETNETVKSGSAFLLRTYARPKSQQTHHTFLKEQTISCHRRQYTRHSIIEARLAVSHYNHMVSRGRWSGDTPYQHSNMEDL